MDHFRKSLAWVVVTFLLAACASTPTPASSSGNDSASGKGTTQAATASARNEGAEAGEPATRQHMPVTQLTSTYHIGVDDVVQVSVWRNENLSVTVPVRPDGMISIPLAGDVLAGGKTPEQVAVSIEKKLSRYIRAPQVTVILTQLNSHEYLSRVRVTGAVRNPISVSYRQGMTILDVVLTAGGVTEFAAPNRTRLYRKNGTKTKSFRIHLGDILNKGQLKTNLELQPGDVITVPERVF